MKINKKFLLGSAIAALLSNGAVANAQTEHAEDAVWQARTVEEVKQDLVYHSENEISYTVKYGDTLSVVSEALDVPLNYLAMINEIEHVDLIFPQTILTTNYDANNRASNIKVEAPSGDIVEVALPETEADGEELEVSFISETFIDEEVTVSETETADEAELVGVAPAAEFLAGETQSTVDYLQSELGQPVNDTIEFVSQSTDYEQELQAGLDQDAEVAAETQAVNLQAEETAVEFEEVQAAPVVEAPVVEETVEEFEEVHAEPIVEVPVVEEAVEEYEEVQTAPIVETPVVEETVEEFETPQAAPIVETPAPIQEPEPEPIPEPVVTDPYANPQNAGLSPDAASFKEEVTAIYGVEDFSLVRPGDSGDHGQGKAVDFMTYSDAALGNQIADYSISNMAANGISYVIWQQQIYGDWNQSWEWMEDRGSITANHYDHVHVSFH